MNIRPSLLTVFWIILLLMLVAVTWHAGRNRLIMEIYSNCCTSDDYYAEITKKCCHCPSKMANLTEVFYPVVTGVP